MKLQRQLLSVVVVVVDFIYPDLSPWGICGLPQLSKLL
jgi:hypothetical protein